MAVIRRVVYTDLPGQAKNLRETGRTINEKMVKLYESIGAMSSNWYGVRYNELVDAFNKMTVDFNSILELVYTKIPSTIETIAENYRRVDNPNSPTFAVDTSSHNKLQDIRKSEQVGMKFESAQVESVKEECNSLLAQVLDYLNDVEGQIGRLSWESDASDAFRAEFDKLKRNIFESISNVKQQFDTSMAQTLQDMQSAETANTVG